MSYTRLAERLYNTPLLITPEKAAAIEHVFRLHAEGRAAELPEYEAPERIDLASTLSMRRADGGYYITNAGVAVVRVHGSLVQRAGGMDAMSGMTGYNGLAAQLSAALQSNEVRGIVLEIDSPGGEVAGLAELADYVASADKPVYAHANELAASAAYWLATSADRVYAPQTAVLGSIGVVMLHVDRSKQNERAGVTYTPIFAGARKVDGASFAPLSDAARASAQSRVDEIYSLFVKQVAGRRKMTEKAVRETEAGVYSAPEAMKRKLIDGVATLGDTVQAMTHDLNAGTLRKPTPYGRAAVTPAQPKQETRSMEDDKVGTTAAPAANAALTKEQLDASKAEGVKAGSEAERARVRGITTHAEAAGRTSLAEHLAYETAMSVDDAAKMLAKAPKEAAATPPNALAALMPPNPKVGADAKGAADDEQAQPVIDSTAIYKGRAQARLVSVQ